MELFKSQTFVRLIFDRALIVCAQRIHGHGDVEMLIR
jgi:hypothetical protein